ncbi:hypothetical protein K3217_28795 [bacterium BD-1]|uniref:hypothetical protein n=1 Tax=Arenimonas sp. TaxID=1872635 RepID=UPI001E3FB52F|nr:hypothetical protein [Ottowia caeni]
MKGLLALFPILLLASLAQAEESVWHPIEAGCHEQSPYASLRDWRNAPRSTSTLRFAVEPDTGRGPTVVVAMDTGLNRALKADGKPVLLVAVGDTFRTCVTRVPLSACEAAPGARETLLATEIPVGRDHDSGFILRLHAATFHLQWTDGSGQGNAVSYTDDQHPVSLAVGAAMKKLDQCIAPAMKAYRDRAS